MARADDDLFAPITVARASSAIADQIRGAIVSGRLTEGERLSP
jgi:DNA-binding GntR family transcriptional regulator